MNKENLVDAIPLNSYCENRTNLYILEYRKDKENFEFLKTSLSERYNLILLRYDLLACASDPRAAEMIVPRLAELISSHKNTTILGHSYSGYVAHQLACMVPEVLFTVMVDTGNPFLAKSYPVKHVLSSFITNFFKQIIINNDYGYPLHLLSGLSRRIFFKNKGFEENFAKASYNFFEKNRRQCAWGSCIFFKASRAPFRNVRFGNDWSDYFSGKIFFTEIVSGHVQMVSVHAPKIASVINSVVSSL